MKKLLSFKAIIIHITAAILFFIILDKLLGHVYGEDKKFYNLAFPPYQTIKYETRDFHFISQTNRLGFRGPDFPIKRTPGTLRILVLGNSFAYGWGVNFEDTWPHLLEMKLRAEGYPVEIANLATPGTTPTIMTDIAKRAIPLLKPDLVLITALQGGALTTFQGGEAPARKRPINDTRGIIISNLKYFFPNIVLALETSRNDLMAATVTPASKIKQEWKKEAALFLKSMSLNIRQRYNKLDVQTVQRFEEGDINAPVVRAALTDPKIFESMVKSSKTINNGVVGMTEMFKKIKEIADFNKAKTIVVSMPYGAFLGGEASKNLRRIGFKISPDLYDDRTTELAIQHAASQANISFITVLDKFQEKSHSTNLFIPFDGHYNTQGTFLYATLLSKELARRLKTA